MLWVIEISKILKKTKTQINRKIYKMFELSRDYTKQDKIYCIQENNRGYIMEKYMKQLYAKAQT